MNTTVTGAARLPVRSTARPAVVATAGAGALALTVVAGAMGASAPGDDSVAVASLRGAMVGAPLAAAFVAWPVPAFRRFAYLLAVLGVCCFFTTLAESRDADLYSVGRAAGWAVELLVVALLLAFPDGRLRDRRDQVLAATMAATVALFYLPTLLLSDRFQVPSPYTSCVHDCPANAFFVLGEQPGFVMPVFLGTGSVLVLIVMAAVLVRLRGRIDEASTVQRRVLVPVLVAGIARTALVGGAIVARQADLAPDAVRICAWLIAIATPAVAIAFLVGVVRARLAAESALRTLTAAVHAAHDLPTLQRATAGAFGDPTLALTFPRHDALHLWLDVRGEPAPPPDPVPGRCTRLVRDDHDEIVGAMDADGALADRPELLDAAAGVLAMALERRRSEAEAARAAHEAHDTRVRQAAIADRERRRIERDLHDGAQQRLVALRIELGLVEDMLEDDPAGAAARIRELEASAEEALDELRSVAHGVCPPLLADRGLREALRAAVDRSPVPVAFDADPVGRYAPEVESAVYFCLLEALQNVAKHAPGARHAVLRLDTSEPGHLRFSLRDDGPGTSETELAGGHGIANMRDRITAVDGVLHVTSRPGVGTAVRGYVTAASC
jgi:signal transduction histidine kinase